MRLILEYVPPFSAWVPALVMLAVFFAARIVVQHRRVDNPEFVSFAVSVAILVVVATVSLAINPLPANSRMKVTWVRSIAPAVTGILVYLGALAIGQHRLRRQRMWVAVIGMSAIAVVGYPISVLSMLYVACMAGAGCI